MLTCKEIIEFLMDYSSGELDPDVRSRFEEHIRICPPCVAFMQNYEETVKMGRVALKDPCTEHHEPVPPELIQAILKSRTEKP